MFENSKTEIDAIGRVKAAIAELEAQEKALRDSIADRETIDWRAIAEKLAPSRQLVTAHTSAKTVTTVRVVARK